MRTRKLCHIRFTITYHVNLSLTLSLGHNWSNVLLHVCVVYGRILMKILGDTQVHLTIVEAAKCMVIHEPAKQSLRFHSLSENVRKVCALINEPVRLARMTYRDITLRVFSSSKYRLNSQ